ncbi:hypothetical protein GF362_07030 [Candidatus Dojkabacteria bacterium]|nr:hypothetical protein [Candidatus Dojkabacteria bacterium]
MIKEVCKQCSLYKRGCRASDPVDVFDEWLSPNGSDYLNCRHYTCRFGRNAALDAMRNTTPENLNGLAVVPFGTKEKPFDNSPRYVVTKGKKGQILTTFSPYSNKRGNIYQSAVTIKI